MSNTGIKDNNIPLVLKLECQILNQNSPNALKTSLRWNNRIKLINKEEGKDCFLNNIDQMELDKELIYGYSYKYLENTFFWRPYYWMKMWFDSGLIFTN